MSVFSANGQTARDPSPVHGLRGFVCFREKSFFTCVDTCVIQHCTATSHAIFNQFLVSLPWLETLLISFPIAQ